MAKRNLTTKQLRFVGEYIDNGFNGPAAYRVVYSPSASDKVASNESVKLLRHHEISVIVAEARAKAVARVHDRYAISKGRIVAELARLAFANMEDFTRRTETGELLTDFSAVDRDHMAAVQEVIVEEYKEGRAKDAPVVKRTRFKLADKGQNLERLAKIMGYVIEKRQDMPLNIDDMTDAQIDALLASAEAKLKLIEGTASEVGPETDTKK